MKKTIIFCAKTLHLFWQANRGYAVTSIVGKIYESTLYPFIQVLVLARFLDLLGNKQPITLPQILSLGLFYVIASLIRMVVTSFLDTQQVLIDINMDNYLDLQIDKKLTQLDPATFESADFQELLAQMEGVKGTINVNTMRITGFIDSVFKLITAAIVLAPSFPLFIPIMLVATLPSFFAMDLYRRSVWKYFVEERSALVRISQYVKNLLSQDSTSKEVAIYKTGDLLYEKVKTHQREYIDKFTHASQSGLPPIMLTGLIQLAAFIYTQILNLRAVISGTLGVGAFTLYFQQTSNLLLGTQGILDNYSSINMRNKYIDKYFEFMSTKRQIPPLDNPIPLPENPMPFSIEFKHVSFKYPQTKRYILEDFNIIIKPGEKIALVGENGVGKTTLIKLLLRFYDVTDGEILINGLNIKLLDLEMLNRHIGALFQDFIKYQFTFKENIYFGNRDQKDNQLLLKQAITQSGADEFLQDLPDKYNQVVGKMFKHGIDLSGGQWQKLALARAFFKNAPILILDEPTSSIDAKAEYEIFERVQKLQKDKTVIIISHRFSTVRHADRIIVLDKGKIIEEGDHETLMQKQGLYAELFEIQAKGYK